MLRDLGFEQQVYLAAGFTDMRKSINGLAAIVQESFQLNPFSSCLFVFCNRARDKIKVLQWDNAGFWLHYRRLERGRFRWPESVGDKTIIVSRRELNWLLDGLSIRQPNAHKSVTVSKAI